MIYSLLKKTLNKAAHYLNNAQHDLCLSFIEWCSENHIQITQLNDAAFDELFEFYSRTDNRLAESTIGFHKNTLSRPQVLACLDNVRVCGALGLVFLPDKKVVFEGNWWLPYLEANADYKRRFYFKRQSITGNVYSLLCMWATNYYHWFIDVLPRLAAAMPFLPGDTKFLINENPSQWQLDSLAAFGIDRSRLVFQYDAMRSKVEHLWFATPVCQTGYATRQTLLPVVTRLKEFFGASEGRPFRKLYISRRKANRRQLLNEDAVLKKILPLGFEVLFCEEMPLGWQVKAFAEAQTIVGPHGAGFTNLIYAPSGCKIYEINHDDKIYRGHYWFLSSLLGHSFECLKAEKVNLSGEEFDLVADLTQLEAALE